MGWNPACWYRRAARATNFGRCGVSDGGSGGGFYMSVSVGRLDLLEGVEARGDGRG